MRRLVLLAAALALLAPAMAALAQPAPPFPDRPIRLVVPWPPGGGTDVLARALAARMSADLGQPVVVDNRAGANGSIGTAEAARARADGHTILMATADTHGIGPAVRRDLPYDAVRDFAPVLWATTQPLILCVHPGLGPTTLAEFVALARARPGAVDYASWGAGSTAHLAMELFRLRAGIEATHVPYRGAAPAVTDLVGGQVAAMFVGPLSANPNHAAGRLRCLATGTEARPASAPDVPTFAEAGFTGVRAEAWFGLVAPTGVPAPALAALRAAAARALDAPEVRERIAAIGQDPVGGDPERFGAHVAAEVERWREVVRAANVVVE